MTTLRAHFDGRVLVPDEPVDLPVGKSLELVVRDTEPSVQAPEVPIREERFGWKNGLPVIFSSKEAPPITPEDVQRAEDDE
jgi:hypothetical protein